MASDDRSARRVEELAREPIDVIDEQNLDRLAALYTARDPVPAGLIERLKFGLTFDALDAELAELQTLTSAGARAEQSLEATVAQTVTFSTERLAMMVTISAAGFGTVRVDGWLTPGVDDQVELRLAEQTLRTVGDRTGRFVFESVPRGLATFLLRPPGPSRPVVTPSLEL